LYLDLLAQFAGAGVDRCVLEAGVESLVLAIVRQWPAEPDRSSSLQISMNGRLTNRATAGDLFLPETEPEPET
jgi:hypothetical protein